MNISVAAKSDNRRHPVKAVFYNTPIQPVANSAPTGFQDGPIVPAGVLSERELSRHGGGKKQHVVGPVLFPLSSFGRPERLGYWTGVCLMAAAPEPLIKASDVSHLRRRHWVFPAIGMGPKWLKRRLMPIMKVGACRLLT